MEVIYKIWKKYNEIQLPEHKMYLKNQRMKNHPPSPLAGLSVSAP